MTRTAKLRRVLVVAGSVLFGLVALWVGVAVVMGYRHPVGDFFVLGDASCAGARVLLDHEVVDTLRLVGPVTRDMPAASTKAGQVTAWLFRAGEPSTAMSVREYERGPHLVEFAFDPGDTLRVRTVFAEYNDFSVSRSRRRIWVKARGVGSENP